VLFAVLKCLVLQKRHGLLPTRHPGYASIRQYTLMSTKTYTEIPDEQKKRTKKERKIQTVRLAGLKTRRSFSYTIITNNSCF
jgi:hypothetical protein